MWNAYIYKRTVESVEYRCAYTTRNVPKTFRTSKKYILGLNGCAVIMSDCIIYEFNLFGRCKGSK